MGGFDIKEKEAHTPVLTKEIVEWLRPVSTGCYVDCTLGPGGLAKVILEKSRPSGKLVAIDQDRNALVLAKDTLEPYLERTKLLCGNFNDIKSLVGGCGVYECHGIVFDLGISSAQLADPIRGFSFLEEGPLDMRMAQTDGLTAADLLNTLSEIDLRSLIFQYGEERYARRIASLVVRTRHVSPLHTTQQLVDLIRQAVPAAYRHGRLHCATRTFQALRIAVNQELHVLEGALRDAATLLVPGGRLCVISFHSLEDRIVKHTFRSLAQGASSLLTLLTKKPLMASMEERHVNPRARSAKLRVAERRELVQEA